jgi:hypothetical protein
MNTVEVPVYEKDSKTYCSDCRPRGSKPSTLITSSYRHCCSGCGESFKEIAEGLVQCSCVACVADRQSLASVKEA